MPSTSNSRKKRGSDADSAADSNVSASSKSSSDEKPSSSPATNLQSSTSGTSTTLTGGAEHQHQTTHSVFPPLAATAAQTAPVAPTSGKKSRKAGFREQFLQQLRVMLDRESLNDDSLNPNPIHWSTDGSTFIINDQNRFEEIIPAYFGNKIAFASFLRKLQRWGFKRVSSSRRKGHYEFCLPAFKRMDVIATTPAASSDSNTSSNNLGVGTSMQFHQQQSQISSLMHQLISQLNQTQTPATNPSPSLATANANPGNISNMQLSSQYPSTPSQHSVNINSAIYSRNHQNIVGSSQQQPYLGQQLMQNQQLLPNHSGSQQNNNVGVNNHLQPSQQWQHSNPTTNAVNVMNDNPFLQSSVLGALIALSGSLSLPPVANNMNIPPAASPTNILSVIPFLALLQQLNEEEQRRRAQVDALHQTIIATLGHLVGSSDNNIGDGRTQNGTLAALGQSIGNTGISQNITNPSGMTVYIENNNTAQSQQVDIPPQSVGDKNEIRADSISAILQVARQRGDATEPFEVGPQAINNHGNDNNRNEGQDENVHEVARQPPEGEQYDDYDDDDSWNIRLRPRKKSPPK